MKLKPRILKLKNRLKGESKRCPRFNFSATLHVEGFIFCQLYPLSQYNTLAKSKDEIYWFKHASVFFMLRVKKTPRVRHCSGSHGQMFCPCLGSARHILIFRTDKRLQSPLISSPLPGPMQIKAFLQVKSLK